jgi:hypothetical protein
VDQAFDQEASKRSILAVGPAGGRGFVVDIDDEFLVVTAAHCLPRLPVPGPPDTGELTFFKLLGPLGGELAVAAECKFVDPVSDLAVFGTPDNQALLDESSAYETLVAQATALSIADVRGAVGEDSLGWLFSLAGVWFKCKVSHHGGGLFVSEASQGIEGGMSGSPILRDDGAVIGVISTSSSQHGEIHTSGGPNPRLTHHLPGCLLRRERA